PSPIQSTTVYETSLSFLNNICGPNSILKKYVNTGIVYVNSELMESQDEIEEMCKNDAKKKDIFASVYLDHKKEFHMVKPVNYFEKDKIDIECVYNRETTSIRTVKIVCQTNTTDSLYYNTSSQWIFRPKNSNKEIEINSDTRNTQFVMYSFGRIGKHILLASISPETHITGDYELVLTVTDTNNGQTIIKKVKTRADATGLYEPGNGVRAALIFTPLTIFLLMITTTIGLIVSAINICRNKSDNKNKV
ncbi:MAG: hypothetical protein MHPSP_003424, partial [Paramarteilia canceri]